MINFDFEYYKPTSWKEAVTLYKEFRQEDKQVMYFAGGTEFISRARMNEVDPDVIIDLKGIPECQVIEQNENDIVIGATATLTDVAETNIFPLLSKIIRQIATKTARNKITVGGNIMSHLPYKEAVLPLLLADSTAVIATENGLEKRDISQVIYDKVHLHEGEFILQLITDTSMAQQPFFSVKKTKQSNVNYPIVTTASIQVDGTTRFACSGLCEYPFRMKEIDEELSNQTTTIEDRLEKVIELLPQPILDDMHATKRYRAFVLQRSLMKMMKQMEGAG